MRFKHNPLVSAVALLILAAILLALCSGCGITTEAEVPSRFTCERAAWLDGVGELYIITDTETGEQYLLADGAYGTGFTNLEG